MSDEDAFNIRPGRIRYQSLQRQRPFIAQALAAAQKAGATWSNVRKRRGQTFGRGRRATLVANRLLTNRSRLAVIKARVVRHRNNPAPLRDHLRYLQREGVTREGERAVLFDKDSNAANREGFAETCANDRHHFRFIISPEDAHQLSDLRQFTRGLMTQAEVDLGSKLDWVGVTHWNTEHPHIHVILRGRTDTGEDLVISRDYIREGMRSRAQGLITDELGPRMDNEIRQALNRQIEASRFTQLDRELLREAGRNGYVDAAPFGDQRGDEFQVLKAGRIRKLEALGLADQFAPGQWIISDDVELILRELGERGDIIKRIHRALGANQIDRGSERYAFRSSASEVKIVGRLLDKGLDDELRGTAYVVIDGLDGQTHYVRLPSIGSCSDATGGAIVAVTTDRSEGKPAYLSVLSDLDLNDQIKAMGATWLDRQAATAQEIVHRWNGFGAEVAAALDKRAAHLVEEGLATRSDSGINVLPDLVAVLKTRELANEAFCLTQTYGRPASTAEPGDFVAGVYRERRNLASGRFAVLDDGSGLQLVPWSPKLDAHTGEWVTGTMSSPTRVQWDLTRQRDLGLDR